MGLEKRTNASVLSESKKKRKIVVVRPATIEEYLGDSEAGEDSI